MGSILKRFDRPLSSRKNAAPPPQPVKSTPEQDAKALHDSVAATLRMFMEDDIKRADRRSARAETNRKIQARERASYRAKNQEVLAGILKKLKESK